MTLPGKVRIVEVGPRDGLQNESADFDTDTRIELVRRLLACGVDTIEAGSFVSPKWVPKMADTAEVLAAFDDSQRERLSVLVPNMRGLELALEAGAREVLGALDESVDTMQLRERAQRDVAIIVVADQETSRHRHLLELRP